MDEPDDVLCNEIGNERIYREEIHTPLALWYAVEYKHYCYAKEREQTGIVHILYPLHKLAPPLLGF